MKKKPIREKVWDDPSLRFFFLSYSHYSEAMTDSKHELKRASTRPDSEVSGGPKHKEKKIRVEDPVGPSEEKDVKGLVSPPPTISAGIIQNLVLHPVAERDPDRVGRHYSPCPPPSTGDIARDHAINEWVFNHLPLSEEQKKSLMHNLNLERRKSEIMAESLTMRSKNLKALQEKEKERLRSEHEEEKGHRLGVKEKPPSKSRSCFMCTD